MANLFRKLAPWPVDWLDPAEAIARRTVSLLSPKKWAEDQLPHHDDLAVVTSNKPDYAIRRLMHGFGLHFN